MCKHAGDWDPIKLDYEESCENNMKPYSLYGLKGYPSAYVYIVVLYFY